MKLYLMVADFEHQVNNLGDIKLLIKFMHAQEQAQNAYEQVSTLREKYMKTKDTNNDQ